METQENLSEETVNDSDSRLVPVTESIRYRRRAQSAEKKVEDLTEQLAKEQAERQEISLQLSSIQTEQKLTHKLITAGTIDVESAVLLAKERLGSEKDTDAEEVVEQLRKEKPYLFGNASEIVTAEKTAGARERLNSTHAVLEKAANKAAVTGNRRDLHEYLKLRRNYL
ncbi:hypothetical protein ACFLZ8_01560 [Planctomycetota bacterium]